MPVKSDHPDSATPAGRGGGIFRTKAPISVFWWGGVVFFLFPLCVKIKKLTTIDNITAVIEPELTLIQPWDGV